MKRIQSFSKNSLRAIALAGLLVSGLACADEYAEVTQLVRAGKFAEALGRADQFLSTQPKDPQMRFIRGVIQRDSGKVTEAIVTFTRLTEDYPELPEPYNNLAVLYASQSQFDKARNALEMAIRTNPSYATAHENLGDIYAKLASQAYNKALQLDTGNQAVPPKLALIREIFGMPKATTPAPPSPAAPVAAAPIAPAAPLPAKNAATNSVVASPTPVPAVTIPAPKPLATPVAPPPDVGPVAKEIEVAVADWASAWSARDVKAYLASYGKDFTPPGSMGRKAWEDERTARISSKATISVKVDKLRVTVNGNRATANFRQDYKSGSLAINNSKTLEFAKVGDRWFIVKETVGD
jgi:tetratricopeptide (TPR) repeat protein